MPAAKNGQMQFECSLLAFPRVCWAWCAPSSPTFRLSEACAASRLLAQPVEAQPGGHGRQPGRKALYLGVRQVQPQPRLLHDVFGLGGVAEDPARDPHKPWSFSLEQVRLVHGIHPFTLLGQPTDAPAGKGVTALGRPEPR